MGDRAKAERVLWEYRQNVQKAARMRMLMGLLMSVRGQDYGAHTVNGVSDPVSEVAHRVIEWGKKLSELEQKIDAVERLRDSLPLNELDTSQMSGILRHRYMEHKDADAVMRKLGITRTTYYRRNNELLNRAEEYVV